MTSRIRIVLLALAVVVLVAAAAGAGAPGGDRRSGAAEDRSRRATEPVEAPAEASSPIGVITVTAGSAERMPEGGAFYLTVGSGASVYLGDCVLTSIASQVELTLLDGSRIVLVAGGGACIVSWGMSTPPYLSVVAVGGTVIVDVPWEPDDRLQLEGRLASGRVSSGRSIAVTFRADCIEEWWGVQGAAAVAVRGTSDWVDLPAGDVLLVPPTTPCPAPAP